MSYEGGDETELDLTYTAIPLSFPGTPLVGLNRSRESMESNLTDLRLAGLKIDDWQGWS